MVDADSYPYSDEYDEAARTFLCHACGSVVDVSEGGDGCADDVDAEDGKCFHDVPCFYVCARCWCDRRSAARADGSEPAR